MSSKTAPTSYLDQRRPPLLEALQLEGGTLMERTESLKRKGYYTPPPRPWQLGVNDRGLGRGDYAVLDKFGDLVVAVENRETAEFIIDAVNSKG
jgi:hypothetical protein